MSDFGSISINATAKQLEKIANMEIQETGELSNGNELPVSKVVKKYIDKKSVETKNYVDIKSDETKDYIDQKRQIETLRVKGYVGEGGLAQISFEDDAIRVDGIHLYALCFTDDFVFSNTILLGPLGSVIYVFDGENWVDTSYIDYGMFRKGDVILAEAYYNEENVAYTYFKLLQNPSYEEWKNAVSSVDGLDIQYKKNGNLVTVRFNNNVSDEIGTGTLLGTIPYACGNSDSYLGTCFAVTTFGGGIYNLKMQGNELYLHDVVYGTNNFNLYCNTIQFTYSI